MSTDDELLASVMRKVLATEDWGMDPQSDSIHYIDTGWIDLTPDEKIAILRLQDSAAEDYEFHAKYESMGMNADGSAGW